VQLGEHSWQYLRAHTWHMMAGALVLFGALYLLMVLVERRRTRSAV
jgi:hypothetical protein